MNPLEKMSFTIGNKLSFGGFTNGYNIKTLENNVNEDRFDLKYITEHKPTISQYGQNYETTSKVESKIIAENNQLGKELLFTKINRRPVAFPGHQPEIDITNQHSYKTTYGEFTKNVSKN